MYSVALFGQRVTQRFSYFSTFSRFLCNQQSDTDGTGNGFGRIEDYLNESWKSMKSDNNMKDNSDMQESVDFTGMNGCYGGHFRQKFSTRHDFIEKARNEASMILEILQQDGPGFDAKTALDNSHITVSSLLVREVLLGILKTINYANKNRCAKLGYKFFVWSGQKENYRHTANSYQLIMKIFAESEEFKAMWRLVDEMTEKGYPTTGYVVAGELDIAQELFIDMRANGQLPNVFTYNSMIRGLCMAEKFDEACMMVKEMESRGCNPNFMVYNTLVSYLKNAGKLSKAHEVIRHMVDKGQYVHLVPKFKRYRRC